MGKAAAQQEASAPALATRWGGAGVSVVRAAEIEAQKTATEGGKPATGRALAFNFDGSGGGPTSVGAASLGPGAKTGGHHHGHHEVLLYVVAGRCRLRWGERLESAADVGPGDFAYFPPFVPHQEINLDPAAPVSFVVVRSDPGRIVEPLAIVPVEPPAMVA